MSFLAFALVLATILPPWTRVFVLGNSTVYPPYDYGFDAFRLARRQNPGAFITKGASAVNGTTPVRVEVRQLEQDTDKWDLFMLGLNMMQYMNESYETSWYSITGIHGVPYDVWAGVRPLPGNEQTGYCTHINTLFPTWHRPYLALYEQVLHHFIQSIASWFPANERARYTAAAADFRIPYWDWAMAPPTGENVLPDFMMTQTVLVNGPNGMQRIANPLFSYQFHGLDDIEAFYYYPFTIWNTTIRSPPSNDNPISNNTEVSLLLNQNQPSAEQRVYHLFTNYANYSTFSSEAWYHYDSDSGYDSLEGVHDTIHTLGGGMTGHMSYIDFSAFDPMFFLHHVMIDRLFAMWQVLYPESWVVPTVAITANANTYIGMVQDGNTGLTPFWAGNGSLWTSNMVRDPEIFSYTYPELQGATISEVMDDPDVASSMRTQVITAINELYGSSSPSSLARKTTSRSPGPRRVRRRRSAEGRKEDTVVNLSLDKRSILDQQNRYYEWVANVHVAKQALDKPFVIHFFLGNVPEDPRLWSNTPDHVGSLGVFASGSNSMKMANAQIGGTIPLTAGLVDRVSEGLLSNLSVESVEPFLRENLQYRIVAGANEVFNSSAVPSLGIRIVSSLVSAPYNEDELPSWGPVDAHFDLV